MDQISNCFELNHDGNVEIVSTDFSGNRQPSFDYAKKSTTENNPAEETYEIKPVLLKTRKPRHQCPECNKTFSKASYFRRHVSSKHPNQLKNIFPSKNYMCDICEKSFNCMGSVSTHRRRHHNMYIVLKTYKCPLCLDEFERREFSKHFESSHSLPLIEEKLNFDTFDEFLSWKKTMEKETKSYFTKESTKTTNRGVRHFYICHRSGNYVSKVNEGKRKIRAQGSRKINAYCPAVIKITLQKGKECEVIFQSQHVGHDNEARHLNLTSEDRKIIAEKLASKLPLDVILNDLRNSVSGDGSHRLRLLKRKDLSNIKASLLKNESSECNNCLSMEKVEDFHKTFKNDIREKHIASINMKAELTNLENGWMLTSTENNEMYFIKENQLACSCPFVCTYCKACVQSYSCSCPDSSTKGNMCEHIHFFCAFRNQEEPTGASDENDFLDCEDLIEVKTKHEKNDFLQMNAIDGDVTNEQSIDEPSVMPYEISFEKRNDLKKEYANIIDSIVTMQEYEVLENTLSQLTPKLISIRNESASKIVSSSAITHSSNSVSINKHLEAQCNSKSPKTVTRPLIHQIQKPIKIESPPICYILNFSNITTK